MGNFWLDKEKKEKRKKRKSNFFKKSITWFHQQQLQKQINKWFEAKKEKK